MLALLRVPQYASKAENGGCATVGNNFMAYTNQVQARASPQGCSPCCIPVCLGPQLLVRRFCRPFMFLAIPLENKPSWRSPPWMTVLLIVINCLIFWGWQAPRKSDGARGAGLCQDGSASHRAAAVSGSPRSSPHRATPVMSAACYRRQKRCTSKGLWAALCADVAGKRFRQRLLAGQIITTSHPDMPSGRPHASSLRHWSHAAVLPNAGP